MLTGGNKEFSLVDIFYIPYTRKFMLLREKVLFEDRPHLEVVEESEGTAKLFDCDGFGN